MRAHRFRPILDKLDGRIVLDSGASSVVALPVTQLVVSVSDPSTTGMMPGQEVDGPGTWDWIVAGAPPSPTYDLTSAPVDPTSVASSPSD